MSPDDIVPVMDAAGQILVPVLVALIALFGKRLKRDHSAAEIRNDRDHARNYETLQKAVEGVVRIEAKTDAAQASILSDISNLHGDVLRVDDKVDGLTIQAALAEGRLNVLEDI